MCPGTAVLFDLFCLSYDTCTHRYTRNAKREEQLFDLRADPDELNDLKSTDRGARALMIEQLMDALVAADDAARGAPVRD